MPALAIQTNTCWPRHNLPSCTAKAMPAGIEAETRLPVLGKMKYTLSLRPRKRQFNQATTTKGIKLIDK